MRKGLKEKQIDAILKRTREVLEKAELVQSARVTIELSTETVTAINYDIEEVIIDWETKDD